MGYYIDNDSFFEDAVMASEIRRAKAASAGVEASDIIKGVVNAHAKGHHANGPNEFEKACKIFAAAAKENTTDKFGTGAVRSSDAEAVRYDLISPIALEELAKTYAEGSLKYDDFNWEKGMPVHDLLNHAIRHLYKFLSGDRSEPHLPHAMWGVGAAIHSLAKWPHLNDGHLRGPDCEPPKGDAADATKEPYPTANFSPHWGAAFGQWMVGGVASPPLGGDGASAEPTIDYYPGVPCDFIAVPPRNPLAPSYAGRPRDNVTVYLSGPMSGIPENNFPAFDRVATVLRHRGWRVVSPSDFGDRPGETWESHLQRDLFIVACSDVLVQLPDWEKSRGANLEFHVAKAFDKEIVSLTEILDLG